MQTSKYPRSTLSLFTLGIALVLSACSSGEIGSPPCDGTGGSGTSGTGDAASSSSSSGVGGEGGNDAVVIDINACTAMAEWCAGPYLWPNTLKGILEHGTPTCYCACNLLAACNQPGAPQGGHCGLLLREVDGATIPFFTDSNTFTDGRPYVCLFDDLTPVQ